MAATKTKSLTLYFVTEKETPGTVRFREDVAPGVRGAIGTLYLTKAAHAELGSPENLTVTVKG